MKILKAMWMVLWISLLGLVFLTSPLLAQDSPSADGKQTTCPVMGGKINKNLYADADGKRVYFCCAGCSDLFRKDPQAYFQKMKEQGVTPDKAE